MVRRIVAFVVTGIMLAIMGVTTTTSAEAEGLVRLTGNVSSPQCGEAKLEGAILESNGQSFVFKAVDTTNGVELFAVTLPDPVGASSMSQAISFPEDTGSRLVTLWADNYYLGESIVQADCKAPRATMKVTCFYTLAGVRTKRMVAVFDLRNARSLVSLPFRASAKGKLRTKSRTWTVLAKDNTSKRLVFSPKRLGGKRIAVSVIADGTLLARVYVRANRCN